MGHYPFTRLTEYVISYCVADNPTEILLIQTSSFCKLAISNFLTDRKRSINIEPSDGFQTDEIRILEGY